MTDARACTPGGDVRAVHRRQRVHARVFDALWRAEAETCMTRYAQPEMANRKNEPIFVFPREAASASRRRELAQRTKKKNKKPPRGFPGGAVITEPLQAAAVRLSRARECADQYFDFTYFGARA
jgi:hypothetical protein